MLMSPDERDGFTATRIAIGAFAMATALPMFVDFNSFALLLELPCMIVLLLVSAIAGFSQTKSTRPLRIGALFAPVAVAHFFARVFLAVAIFEAPSSTSPPLEWILGIRAKVGWISLVAF